MVNTMRCKLSRRWLSVAVLLCGGAGCAEPSGGDGKASEARSPTRGAEDPATAQAPSPTRIALPALFGIMQGLQENMDRISHALWVEDFEGLAVAAEAVADHPRVPAEEFERISGVLGPDMSRFGAADMAVHDLAVRLAEEARGNDLEAALATDAELRRGCAACHSEFRERLRAGIP